MSHNLFSLQHQSFNSRVTLGGCLININGSTVDCDVQVDTTNFTSPTYQVEDKGGRVLCTFRPYHLSDGPTLYSIEGASESGGDATLIVPNHGLLVNDEDDEDEDDD